MCNELMLTLIITMCENKTIFYIAVCPLHMVYKVSIIKLMASLVPRISIFYAALIADFSHLTFPLQKAGYKTQPSFDELLPC